MTFPRIHVKGTPYECGKQFGEQARELVLRCLDYYKDLFEEMNISWETASQRALDYIPYINKYDPDLMEEMQGISDAIGRPVLDIVTLNARSEVIFSARAIDGCTTISAVPPLTDGATYIAQNWDLLHWFKDVMVIVEIEQEEKPKILMVTEAGIIGKIGMNSAGIGVCLNALGCEGTPGGLPIHLSLRGVLNSKNIGHAIGAAIKMKAANGANFHIASSEGVSVDIELANDGYDVMFNEEGFLVHTNHYISPRLAHIKDYLQELVPDSHIRLGVAKRELKNNTELIGVYTLKAILKNHVNFPDSICKHTEDVPVSKRTRSTCTETVFSIISDLTNQVMHVCPGLPCQCEYDIYRFTPNTNGTR